MPHTSGDPVASPSGPHRLGGAVPGVHVAEPAPPSPAPPDEEPLALEAATWSALLARALDGDGFGVHFQPIVDLVRGAVVGYEALARFTGYPVSDPLTWFEAADRLGRAGDLQGLALRRALTARDSLPGDTFLAVNVGPEVLDHPAVEAVWREHPDLDGVVVELTEHARVPSYERLQVHLDRLRAAGALIALDDTGAGYAGLRHIVGIRPHVIKLDRYLVEGIDHDETKRALVEMIGRFAARVRAEVLAEGIEEGAELDTVVSLGVTLAQGYLLARPEEPWPQLESQTRERLRARRLRSRPDAVHQLVEETRVVTDRDSARAAFADGASDADPVVLVDGRSRPVAVVDGDGVHAVAGPLHRTGPGTAIATVARRAVARIPGQRFRPVMCVDDEGRLLGVVRVERLVDYLADADEEASRTDGGRRRADPAVPPRQGRRSALSHDSGSGGTVVP